MSDSALMSARRKFIEQKFGEYLITEMIALWKNAFSHSNTQAVLEFLIILKGLYMLTFLGQTNQLQVQRMVSLASGF